MEMACGEDQEPLQGFAGVCVLVSICCMCLEVKKIKEFSWELVFCFAADSLQGEKYIAKSSPNV